MDVKVERLHQWAEGKRGDTLRAAQGGRGEEPAPKWVAAYLTEVLHVAGVPLSLIPALDFAYRTGYLVAKHGTAMGRVYEIGEE